MCGSQVRKQSKERERERRKEGMKNEREGRWGGEGRVKQKGMFGEEVGYSVVHFKVGGVTSK